MIRILPPEEAKKIAAGEVVDRPAALVREFIDNALDSGAASIELNIEGGGIDKVEVIDNGSGMNREDLELCVKTHATSKIQSMDDLSRSTTLGFRGEALAAAAATARLEIITSTDGREAWRLETSPDGLETDSVRLTQTRRTRGTSIRASGLFDTIPARKRFLKREASEAALCRQIFIEKALAFPEVSFRFTQNGQLKLQLLPYRDSPVRALQKRFGDILFAPRERVFLHGAEQAGQGFRVTVIFGGPELFRHDRRQEYIFANKRRIQDYSLMQALEYGLAGFFPNGSHPVGAVFVEVDPALADFNIHPAKREVRFADSGAIHHGVTKLLRDYVRGSGRVLAEYAAGVGMDAADSGMDAAEGGMANVYRTPELGFGPADKRPSRYSPLGNTYNQSLAMEALLARRDEFTAAGFAAEPEVSYTQETAPGAVQAAGVPTASVRLVGRAFDLFIIAERQGRLYLIDQHAAHERILYNHFLLKPIVTQELLVAIPFTTSGEEEDRFLKTKQEELKALGIVLENTGGSWYIEALPAGWKESDSGTVEEILSLRSAGTNMTERWAAALACRAAVKDGDRLDDGAALALAEAALALADKGGMPRCPHGRPLWAELCREDLFKAVRRTE
ncbi:DNA mismatch repair protein MutL [Spirochaetia bacterium]|nr:DNA mismatch repair protein MutL [Spirochaetia bacterium]